MFENMRRLHPRGPANRGICVDADGAMLGPECALVYRTNFGFCGIERDDATALQKCLSDLDRDRDWLFRQCQYIAEALGRGELALAQIYGLHIPIGDLDDRQLKRIALTRLAKTGFNPDEPRVPKGNPHGGEWTSDGQNGGGAAPDRLAFLGTAPGGDGSSPAPVPGFTVPGGMPSAGPNVEGSPAGPTGVRLDRPGMEYRFAPTPSDLADSGSEWPWGELTPTTLTALRQMLARMTGATIVFGILFIPTNRSPIAEGPIGGSPDLSYRYDSDTGVLQIRQNIGSLGPVVISEGHIGTDGLFRDPQGHIIGRYLSDSGVFIDAGALPGYRMLPHGATAPDAGSDQASQPKLCPDETPDNPGAPLDNPYQRYVSQLVNDRALAPGMAVGLFNPKTNKNVMFDDCRLTDGTMIEAKGDGYLKMLLKGLTNMPWLGVEAKLLKQANAQFGAAQGRPIEWYFKERPVADYVRELFTRRGIRITVIYAPQPE